jgi:hypothetical protein
MLAESCNYAELASHANSPQKEISAEPDLISISTDFESLAPDHANMLTYFAPTVWDRCNHKRVSG